jgi:hypothetical protein
MNHGAESKTAHLLREYEAALVCAVELGTEHERPLYSLHLKELQRLEQLLTARVSPTVIADLIASEQRAYGWSYLSGVHGESAEQAFLALKGALDAESQT